MSSAETSEAGNTPRRSLVDRLKPSHSFIKHSMQQAEGLRSNPRHFRQLQRVGVSRSKRYDGQPKEARRNAPCGQRRTERRMVHADLVGILIYLCDLVSLRVGRHRPNGWFAGVTVETLARMIELPFSRVERAMSDLYRAGLLTSRQPREKDPDGHWHGFPAVRCLSKALFDALGVGVALGFARNAASKKAKKERRAAEDAARSPEERAAVDRLVKIQEIGSAKFFAMMKELRRQHATASDDELEVMALAELGRARPPPE